MPGGTAAVVIVVILVVVLLAAVTLGMRRRGLRRRFGPEYERAVSEQKSTLRAEAELAGRHRRVRKLDIRPLSDDARRKYRAEAVRIQEEFVDSPETSVAAAHALVTRVMRDRGYPAEDDQQAMTDLSVEHARTVGHFREAQRISTSGAAGDASTEDLRQALIHYRALFADLLDEPQPPAGTDVPVGDEQAGTAAPDPEPDDFVGTSANHSRRSTSGDDVG
jgi:hypothetical protein